MGFGRVLSFDMLAEIGCREEGAFAPCHAYLKSAAGTLWVSEGGSQWLDGLSS